MKIIITAIHNNNEDNNKKTANHHHQNDNENGKIFTTKAEGMTASCSKGSSRRQSSSAVLFKSRGEEEFTPGQSKASPITAAFFLWSHLSAQGLSALPDWRITRLNKPKRKEREEINVQLQFDIRLNKTRRTE